MDNNLFFELLQVALGNRQSLSRVPSQEGWNTLYEESERQAIAGVMLGGLEKLPKEQRPSLDLLLEWIGSEQIIEQTVILHQKRAKEVTELFKDNGYKTCILKGIGMSLLYPNPLARQCGDLDIWTDGNRKEVMSWLRSQYKIDEVRWHHADTVIFDDVQTEIHFHATWLFNPWRNRRLQQWMEKNGMPCMEATADGFNVPSEGFNVIYSLIHSFHHLLECGIGFRHVVDYYYLLKSDVRSKSKEVINTLKGLGLEKFAGAMMYVLKEVCGASEDILLCEPDVKEGKFLLSEIMAAGNFGHQRIGESLPTNSPKRYWVMMKHYPSEVLWQIPWKVWHCGWRKTNRY